VSRARHGNFALQNPAIGDVMAVNGPGGIFVMANGCAFYRQTCKGSPTGVYIVCSGRASLEMRSKTGKVLMNLEVIDGSVLGFPGIIANEAYTFSAIACPGADVRFVARSDFEELVRAEPALYPMVLEILAAEVRSARIALSGLLEKLGSKVSRG